MTIADRIPSLDDTALATLRSNAVRMIVTMGKSREEAQGLLPLIDAEMAERKTKKPAPSPAASGKPAKPKPRAKRKAASASDEEPDGLDQALQVA